MKLRTMSMMLIFILSLTAIIQPQEIGGIDLSFGQNIETAFDGPVNVMAMQGTKILVGGGSSYNNFVHHGLLRLDENGDIDTSFNIGFDVNASIRAIVVDTVNEKIYIGGAFSTYDGMSRSRFARLNYDGTLDDTFNIGTGFNSLVNTIALQEDGKILVGGEFSGFNGVTLRRISRLNTDGSVDTSFHVGTAFNFDVASLLVQEDGKIIAGGNFESFNGIPAVGIARLNTDGTLDTTFKANFDTPNTRGLVSQTDGKILVIRGNLSRLNSDGSPDTAFSKGINISGVNSAAIQSDGKILVGGGTISYDALSINGLIRLNSDGTLDNTLDINEGFNATVSAITVQADSKILAGGNFTKYDNNDVERIVRIFGEGTVDVSEKPGLAPSDFVLRQNYPNPFNPSTKIQYIIPSSSYVELKVFDMLGSEVATLVNEERAAGSYEINFEANGLSTGVYFYTLKAGGFATTKKFILMK